jgi:hypothetical protein
MHRRDLLAAGTGAALAAMAKGEHAFTLTEEEYKLLQLAAVDWAPGPGESYETFRKRAWDEYPTFSKKSAVVALARSMQERGLLDFHDEYSSLCRDGHYTASALGRLVLARETERRA